MRPTFEAFLSELTSPVEAASCRDVLLRYEAWESSCRTTSEALFVAMFGRDRTGYVTVADLKGVGDRSSARLAMLKLGFREVSMYLDGIKTRLWLRGPDTIGSKEIAKLPRFTSARAAPCPVPLPAM